MGEQWQKDLESMTPAPQPSRPVQEQLAEQQSLEEILRQADGIYLPPDPWDIPSPLLNPSFVPLPPPPSLPPPPLAHMGPVHLPSAPQAPEPPLPPGVSRDAFVIRPNSVEVGGSAVRGEVSRVVVKHSDADCIVMSMDYWGVVYTDPSVFRTGELHYAQQPQRISRDIQRKIRYEVGDPLIFGNGEFLSCHLDLGGLYPGFPELGKHKIWCYMPDDSVDRYGPLFSVNGVLRAIGMRAGGTISAAVASVFTSGHSPSELRGRSIFLVTPDSNKANKECFLDLHAFKCFMVAFGFKQMLSSKANDETKFRSMFSDEDVSRVLVARILHAPLCEAK